MRFLFCILTAALMTGCFTPADGQFLCDDGTCPDGTRCVAGVCRIDPVDDDAGPADSGIDGANDSGPADTSVDGSDSGMADACVPSAEMCNGISDDCDDSIDEGACDFPNTEATCEPGGCVVSSCDDGFLDCSSGDGCETASDRMNCGECGMVCGATQSCEAGRCAEHSLDWWWTIEGADVLITSGNAQRYLLSTPNSSAVVLRPSTGGMTSYTEQTDPFSVLVAMDAAGARLWEVYIDADFLDITVMTSVDGADGVFIAGSFQGTLRAGRIQPADMMDSAGTSRDAFVLRVDAAGNVQSVSQLTDPADSDTRQTITDMAVSPNGRIFVVGSTTGDLATSVGGAPILTGRHTGFVYRVGGAISSTPNARWESVSTDSENLYLGARLEDTVMLGGLEFSQGDNFHPLIASYTQNLEFRWARAPLEATSGSGEDFSLRISADDEHVILSHDFGGLHTFGGNELGFGPYIASLSSNDGTVEWAQEVEMTERPTIHVAGGHVYFAGTGVGAVDLGGGSLGAAVGGDAFFGILSASGEYETAKRVGGLDRDVAYGVYSTLNGLLVSGSWTGNMNVDGAEFDSRTSRTFVFHFSTEE